LKPEELSKATVRVLASGGSTSPETSNGTGFFVLPGVVLTCHHVIAASQGGILSDIRLNWGGAADPVSALVVKLRGNEVKESLFPFPDLALLSVDLAAAPAFQGHPCAPLSQDALPGDEAFVYGYSRDNRYGDPIVVRMDGGFPVTGIGNDHEAIKFSLGTVLSGISGSPLLNNRTGRVCGIVKRKQIDLGGFAVSGSTILDCFPELTACFALTSPPDLDTMLAAIQAAHSTGDDLETLIDALLDCPKFETAQGRDQLVGLLPKPIRNRIDQANSPYAHVTAIVKGCLAVPGGLRELVHRLAFFDGETIPYINLRKTVEALYEQTAQNV
jgi:hypothetical protein